MEKKVISRVDKNFMSGVRFLNTEENKFYFEFYHKEIKRRKI